MTQKEAERATAAAAIGKIEALIPLLQQQVDMRKTLFERETGAKLLYLQTVQSSLSSSSRNSTSKRAITARPMLPLRRSLRRAHRLRPSTDEPCSTSSARPSRKPPASPRI